MMKLLCVENEQGYLLAEIHETPTQPGRYEVIWNTRNPRRDICASLQDAWTFIKDNADSMKGTFNWEKKQVKDGIQ